MKLVYILIVMAVLGGGYYLYSEQAALENVEQTVPEIDPRTENTTSVNIPTPEEKAAAEAQKAAEAAKAAEEEANASSTDDDTVKEFTVDAFSFGYSMEEIRVNEGDTVTINLTNSGGFHDWVVDEFEATTEKINEGETTAVTFVADAAGTYEFYCSVGSHRAQGMVGTLIVE